MASIASGELSAKDEIGSFIAPTRFGKNKPPIRRDLPVARPTTRKDAVRQIEEAYRYNRWTKQDVERNLTMLELDVKPLAEFSNFELRIILNDFEKFGTIIYGK